MKLALSYLLLVASFSIQNLEAFQLPLSGGKVTSFVNPKCVSNRSSSASTFLCNVPPPSADDVETIKDSSDRESPPQSFYELQLSSAKAAKLAIKDGFKLLEVEVSGSILSTALYLIFESNYGYLFFNIFVIHSFLHYLQMYLRWTMYLHMILLKPTLN